MKEKVIQTGMSRDQMRIRPKDSRPEPDCYLVHPLTLDLGNELAERLQDRSCGPRFAEAIEQVCRTLGFRRPPLHLSTNPDIRPREYSFRIYDVEVAFGELDREPSSENTILAIQKDLIDVVRGHAACFLGTVQTLELLKLNSEPALSQAVTESFGPAGLRDAFRSLLAERLPIRPLTPLLQIFQESGARTFEASHLEQVKKLFEVRPELAEEPHRLTPPEPARNCEPLSSVVSDKDLLLRVGSHLETTLGPRDEWLEAFRQELTTGLAYQGLPLPGLRLEPAPELAPESYSLSLDERVIAEGEVPAGEQLDWLAGRALLLNARYLLCPVTVERILNRAQDPRLVEQVLSTASRERIAELLGALVAENVSIRYLALILEALVGWETSEPVKTRLEVVRQALGLQLCNEFANRHYEIPAKVFDGKTEQELLGLSDEELASRLRNSFSAQSSKVFVFMSPELRGRVGPLFFPEVFALSEGEIIPPYRLDVSSRVRRKRQQEE